MSLQVELLEQSFEAIKPYAEEFVNSFYENLFTANPEAKPLFDTTDMGEQKKKLLGSLVLVVDNLRKPEVLDSALRGLGARHVKYGALPEHYPLVGSALLTTFEQYLGEKWTAEVKQAWVDAYGAISQIMLDGADYSEAEIALPNLPAAAEVEEVEEFEELGLQIELLEESFAAIKPNADEDGADYSETEIGLPNPPAAAVEQVEKVEQAGLQVELLEESFAAIKPNADEDGADYSEAEIPLPNPPAAAEVEQVEKVEQVEELGLQIEILEQSFETIRPNVDEFVNSFYENLFTANPETKALFVTSDMEAQKDKLVNSLLLVVENLRMPDVLHEVLEALGEVHVKYGALPEHYPLVGSALLTTFEQYLGYEWTPQVKQAWVDAYEVLSQIMIDGANYSQSDIALESPSDDINTSSSSVSQPSSPATVNSQASDLNSSITEEEEEMAIEPNKGKVGLYALAGGGIMGIIAVILIVLL